MIEEEKLQKDIEAIEKEKQEYLDGELDEDLAPKGVHHRGGPGEEGASSSSSPSEKEDVNSEGKDEIEEKEIDVMEISLDEEEINEWIGKLEELRENKGEVDFELDEENELKINYEEEGE